MSIERPIAAEQESGGEPRKTRIGVRVVPQASRLTERGEKGSDLSAFQERRFTRAERLVRAV
jgi:hypothetical protein